MQDFTVTLDVEGTAVTAHCTLDGQWLTVRCALGQRSEPVGGMDPEGFALILLRDMVGGPKSTPGTAVEDPPITSRYLPEDGV